MADYMTLLGADSVGTAGRQMLGAADTMTHAATNLEGSLERHRLFMDDWLSRFEQVLHDDRMARKMTGSNRR